MSYLIVGLCGAISFVLQLIATKAFLPFHGGSASVWVGSLLFFQAFLFLSYVVSFQIIKGQSKKIISYGLIALILNGLGLIYNWKITTSINLISLLLNLTIQYGLIYLALLLISPYLQLGTKNNFFKYYVSSNLGCLLGLLSYPIIIEPYIGLQVQKIGLLVISCLIYGWFSYTFNNTTTNIPVKLTDNRNNIIAYSALGTFLLGSFSSFLIQDVVSFPLLWVLPLVIFLLSYIWAFSEKKQGLKFLLKHQIEILEIVALFLLSGYRFDNVWANSVLALAVFTVIIFIVQANLQNNFTGKSEHSTYFYYLTALGGLIGGILVNTIVPFVFVIISEYVFGIIFLLGFLMIQQKVSKLKFVSFGVIVLILYLGSVYKKKFIIEAKRNFYGTIKLADIENNKVMYHGNILHGKEDLNQLGLPTTYYQPKMVGHYFKNNPKNIAIIGLGAGVMLHYIKDPSQTVDVYEINPQVIELAQTHFTFIKKTPAQINFLIGDGRKKLEETKTQYDLIIIDAFSGDSIPAHLLTYEAFKMYRSKLKDSGVMGVHISNNYINLSSIIKTTGANAGFSSYVETIEENKVFATWARMKKTEPQQYKDIWTDDLNSLLKLIK